MRWSEEEYQDYLRKLGRPSSTPAASVVDDDTEKDFLTKVRGFAKLYGWLTYHTHDSRRSDEGFPDLVLCNGLSLIFAELKTRTGKLSKSQDTWITTLGHTQKVEVYLWRPADLPAIIERLGKH